MTLRLSLGDGAPIPLAFELSLGGAFLAAVAAPEDLRGPRSPGPCSHEVAPGDGLDLPAPRAAGAHPLGEPALYDVGSGAVRLWIAYFPHDNIVTNRVKSVK